MLHEHWAQFRAPLPAHFTGQNAKQLGVVLRLVDTFLVRAQAKLKSRAGSLVDLRNHPFVQFDILGDLIGVSIDTVRQSTLRRRLVRNVDKIADSLDQLSRLKSQVCDQFIYKLVIGCDRCNLSARASAGGQRKTDSKQYPRQRADTRYSRVLRARHGRPRRRRAVEQRDELASPHYSITSAARAIRVGGRLMPSACAVLRLTMNSKCVGNWSGMSAGRAPRKTWTTKSAVLSPIALSLGPYDIRPPSRTGASVSKIVGSRLVLANSTTRLRLSMVSASDTIRMASGRSRVISPKACSKSSGSRTPKVWTLMPRRLAASSAAR